MARTKSANTRMLKPGELIPKFEPAWRRIDGQGYVRIGWYVDENSWIEVYEHRIEDDPVIGKYVTYAHLVKHRNGNKSDNHPDNLDFRYTKKRSRQKT